MFKKMSALVAALGLTGSALLVPAVAHAEGRIRIVEQFGIAYLLLNVVRDQNLIEKHGQAEGLEIKVDWARLSGGPSVNPESVLSSARTRSASPSV